MTPIDHPTFIAAITQLADALPGGKPPTQAGLVVWIQTLKEFPLPEVIDQLDGWAKRATKMPAPADVWKACNDIRTERIEQTARAEARTFRLEAELTFRRSDKVGKALRQLAAEMRDRMPRDPKEWAHVIWNQYAYDLPTANGKDLNEIQIRMACDALSRTRQQANEARSNHRASQRETEPA